MSKQDLTLYDLVSGSDKWKERLAIIYDDGNGTVALTYSQVWKLAGKVCSIIQNHTRSPDIIGLCLEPSQFVPPILLGVLQSDNAFLNFVASSVGYLQSVLDNLSVNIILIQSSKLVMLEECFLKYNVEIISDDELRQIDIILVKLNRKERSGTKWTSLAYCITTSGTTGIPKIVRVPHRCIVPNIIYQREVFNITEEDVVFLSSPLTFDPSIVDIFVTLSSGACLLVTSDIVKTMPNKLLQILVHYKATVLQCTPTLISRFNPVDLYTTLLGSNSPLRVLGLGGEKFLQLSLLNQWRAPRNSTKFYNLYGITEVSCWSSIYEVTEKDIRNLVEDIPIGKPLTDTLYIVKDSEGQTVTNGKGFLYIGSSRRVCYINEEDVQTDFGEVLRSTGDIVHVKDEGDIIYIGRADNQIKRNGKRIDLTEIQQVIRKVPDILHCKVLYRKNTLLVAVVPSRSSCHTGLQMTSYDSVSSKGEQLSSDMVDTVTSFIHKHLPQHYWPDKVVAMEILPMTKHGKCDTDVLWKTVRCSNAQKKIGNFKDLESYLSDIWKDTLGSREEIKYEAMFILRGGDSIQALHLANKIQEQLDVTLPWLLDFIIHKCFFDILKAVYSVFEDSQDKDKQTANINTRSADINTQSAKINTQGAFMAIQKANEKKNLIKEISKKRKYDEGINCENINHMDNHVFYYESNVPVKFRMKSISRCNICSDWLIHSNETISNFNFRSFLLEWRQSFENHTTRANNVSVQLMSDYQMNKVHVSDYNTCTQTDSADNFFISEKWKYNTGKCADASPLIASLRDGRMIIYIGSHSHRFSAIIFDTGQLLWETTLGDRIESSACITVCGNYIVVGCYDYNLYAMNSMTGDVWWNYRTEGEIKSSPIVDPITSLVIFGSHDQCIHAVDIKKKKAAWHTHLGGGSIFGSPCLSIQPHIIFCGTLGGTVAALDGDTGTLMWKYYCGKPVFSSPTITGYGICFGCVDGKIYHLNFNGEMVWTFTTDAPVFSSPTFVDNVIFIGSHDCHMYCISVDGNLVWKVKVQSAVYSSAFAFSFEYFDINTKVKTLKGNQFDTTKNWSDVKFFHTCKSSAMESCKKHYKLKEDINLHFPNEVEMDNAIISDKIITIKKLKPGKFITFASTEGNLYFINIQTGEIILKYQLLGEVFSSPVVYKDGLIIGCRNDFVYSLKFE